MRTHWIAGIGAVLLAATAAAQPYVEVAPGRPEIAFAGHQRYSVRGQRFVRYRIEVTNRADYPASMFLTAPQLPPCGRTRNASRTWVDIYRADGRRIYGFCALERPGQLRTLWFAVPAGTAPPERVYIELKDRLTDVVYRSEAIAIPPPPQ